MNLFGIFSAGPHTTSKMTGIFIDRFFGKMKFSDLAVKYDLSDKSVAGHLYQDAVHRIKTILELMEKEKGTKLKLDSVKDKYKATIGNLPKSHKYFLLNRIFNIEPETISKLEDKKIQPSEIRKMIIRVNDGLRCGEIRLFDATPKEIKESKTRLQSHREAVNKHDRKRRSKAKSI